MWTQVDTRRPFAILLLALSALAWLSLWLWDRSPYGRYLSHHALDAVRGNSLLMLVFIAGWVVMIIAMMLPSSLPLISMFQTITSQRLDQRWLVGLLLLGYLVVWTAFGVVVYAGDWMIHQAVHTSHWLSDRAWLLGPLTLLGAGVYQFTPLKYHCLDKCRSPLGFITTHWQGHSETHQAFMLGVHHGLFCVGCCWSLMLLMFAIGAGSLGWMLVLGTIMAAEKNLPWGRRVAAPIGVALLVSGVALLIVGAPAEHTHIGHE